MFNMPVSGPGSDIWEAERGEFFYCKRGSEVGNAYKSAVICSRESYRERWQNGKNTVGYTVGVILKQGEQNVIYI